GHLSFSAFKRWRLEEQTRFHSLTADLKGNFISLLSHNLNTPVAKMQGMLAILARKPGPGQWKEDITCAEKHVAQLEIGIRSVLIGSALDENSLHPESRSLKALAQEFEQAQGSLSRLGGRAEITDLTADDEDLLFLPLAFDTKVFVATLAAACALFADHEERVRVTLGLHVAETDTGYALRVE